MCRPGGPQLMRYIGSNHEQAPKYLSLRLPTSVKAEVVRRAKADGTSFNQFVDLASRQGILSSTFPRPG
jgi:predicted HicB family RNase H-like nuclease